MRWRGAETPVGWHNTLARGGAVACMARTAGEVSLEVSIDEEATTVRVVGTRDAALIVHSESGEEVYLPPEESDQPVDAGGPDGSPYGSGSPSGNPYEGTAAADSPYGAGEENGRSPPREAEGRDPRATPVGVEPTADGFRVHHPEPATDVRFVR